MEENGQYKSELYSKFKDIGLLDTLKSQMRYKILEKLQVPSTKPSPALNNSSLINKIVNSLISEHLKIQNFNYTLAVFLPEIGKDLLSFEEIIEILNVQKENAKPDLLESLIETFLTKKPKVWEKMNISTQTENLDNIIGLESRLKGVDAEYKKKIGAIEAILPKTLEEKFLVYKKELEKRTKLEMQAEVDS